MFWQKKHNNLLGNISKEEYYVFAVIDNSANRGFRIRRDFHQIQSGVLGHLQSFARINDFLGSVVLDNADRGNMNGFVDTSAVSRTIWHLPQTRIGKQVMLPHEKWLISAENLAKSCKKFNFSRNSPLDFAVFFV